MDDGWVLCHIVPFLCTISVLVMQDTQLQHTTELSMMKIHDVLLLLHCSINPIYKKAGSCLNLSLKELQKIPVLSSYYFFNIPGWAGFFFN